MIFLKKNPKTYVLTLFKSNLHYIENSGVGFIVKRSCAHADFVYLGEIAILECQYGIFIVSIFGVFITVLLL